MSHPEKFFENGKESNTIRTSLNPIDWHKGLREQIENAEKEFSKLPHMKNALHDIVERISERYCGVCFFGRPKVVAYADNLCEECANNMYELDKDNTGPFPVLKRKKVLRIVDKGQEAPCKRGALLCIRRTGEIQGQGKGGRQMKTTLTNIWLWFVAVVFTAVVICSLSAMAASFFYSAYRFLS